MKACEVVVVSAPGCHLCADAEKALEELARDHPLDVRVIEASSEEGRRAVTVHRPGMFPVVLVDGALFSVGRLPRGKLRQLLEGKAA